MTDTKAGSISWIDLTVDDAERIRRFYGRVVGWDAAPVEMGGYADYTMTLPSTDTPAAGICHALGVNADLPAQWLIYITVGDLDASIASCRDLGGEVLAGPRSLGDHGRFCVIRDPAGAVAALFESA
jgi:predicted enzyme related to lactoylglutathione lyase